MKIVGSFGVIYLVLTGLFYNKDTIVENKNIDSRVFIYFSDLTANPVDFQLDAFVDTIDGEEKNILTTYITTNGISDNELKNRLYYFDVEKKYTAVSLSLFYKGYKYLSTPLYKIKGAFFVLDSQSYNVSEETGFRNLSISSKAFADYFVSRIDTKGDTTNYVYQIFDSIENNLFKSLTDYSEDYSKQIKWFDEFEQKEITLKEKWDLVKEKYSNVSKNTHSKNVLFKTSGIIILVLDGLGLIGLAIYGRIRKKRKI
ncbi:MAG: hypothetical protein K6E21_00290 [Bacilli bacterium]|nr:hypothetical protein [Bacilli bacterium]